MNPPLLQLNQIKLNISSFSINDISLDLYPGEIHVLMGENGSGKSLLMQIISGIISPDRGEVLYNGQPLRNRKDIIYIRQDADMFENLSIAENLFFHNLPYKNRFLKLLDYDKLNYQFEQLIKELKLPVTVFDEVKDLGLAQRQIIEFCKAYISNARVVILDEPSAALTHSEKELLYNIVQHIKDKGAGVFYITHRIEDVLAIGDRISVIKKGSLVGTRTVSDTTEEEIIKMMSDNYRKDRYPKIKLKKGRTILSVKNLGYENKLNNINFDLREGEILGVTGLAGSGRTLLANCLFGMTKYEGQILINGSPKNIYSPYAAILNGIAMMPENRMDESIFQSLDTNENLALPSFKRFSRNHIINMDYLKQTVLEYIIKINIPIVNMHDILSYSGGNLQKAIFAKWIMSRAKIFILDEPTRGIDIASKIDIYNFITDLVKKNVCIIYISSDIEEIFGICDRVAVLSDNTLACDVATKDISVEEIVKLATSEKV